MSRVRSEQLAEPADDTTRLLGAIAADDVAAFRQFYDRFAPEVLALCRRVLGRHEDAEDVTSEVFWEMWERRKEYDSRRSSPRTYLILLARSRAIDRLRSKARAPVCFERAPEEHTQTDTPLQAAVSAERRQAAVQAVDLLNDAQREALLLAFFHGLSHREIAARLDSPLGTVKSNIRKGLQKLQHVLREFREVNDD